MNSLRELSAAADNRLRHARLSLELIPSLGGSRDEGSLRADYEVNLDRVSAVAQNASIEAAVDVLEVQADHWRHAVERAEAGLYGICERCGSRIEARRLGVLPMATTCRACK